MSIAPPARTPHRTVVKPPAPPASAEVVRDGRDWLWCPTLAQPDHGPDLLYVSSWPRELAFDPHWLTASRVRCWARPAPGAAFQRTAPVVLPTPGTDPTRWDGRMAHNPRVTRLGDRWYLYYTGSTYDGPAPTPAQPHTWDSPQVVQAHANQRIGLAVADGPQGPWEPLPQPILTPDPHGWDRYLVSNPSACQTPDGKVYLFYKAISAPWQQIRLGVAVAESPTGPYRRLDPAPLRFEPATHGSLEDQFVWHDGRRFHMILKDMPGTVAGEPGAGVIASSDDALRWSFRDPPLFYGRSFRDHAGRPIKLAAIERPSIAFNAGTGARLVAAFATGGEGFWEADSAGVLLLPLPIDDPARWTPSLHGAPPHVIPL